MSVIASTIPTGPEPSTPFVAHVLVQVLTLRIALETLGPPPKGFLLFTDSDQHRGICMVGERGYRVELDYDPKEGIVAVTRPNGRRGAELANPTFERNLAARLVDLEGWAPRRPKLPLSEQLLLDVLQELLAGPWRNLAIGCYIHPTSPTTAWEISPEGNYASVALTKRTLLISGKCGDPWHRVDWRFGWRTKGWEARLRACCAHFAP
jgi:hypothetical protein